MSLRQSRAGAWLILALVAVAGLGAAAYGTASLSGVALETAGGSYLAGVTAAPDLPDPAAMLDHASSLAFGSLAQNAYAQLPDVGPALTSAEYSAGTLELAFDEGLDSAETDYAKIHVRDAGDSTGGVDLDGAVSKTHGNSTITVTFNDADQTTIAGMADPTLDIEADAVSNSQGTGNAEATDREITLPFVTTWTIVAENESVTFPGSGTYDIDWGDGTVENGVTGAGRHLYASADTYTVKVTGGLTGFSLLDSHDAGNLESVEQWGDIEWNTMNNMFRSAFNMDYNAKDVPDLSGVTDMSYAFFKATSFNGTISGWDTSSVTDMSYMFFGAASFNGDISGWDTSAVTNMSYTFSEASSFNQDINTDGNSWDTSAVTDMSNMFSDATSFNGDISGWDTSAVTDMSRMFFDAASFNGDISGWDTSSVTDMSYMFTDALIFNQNINTNGNSWDTSAVTNMLGMFGGATSFNGTISGWDTSSVTDMSYMFFSATSFDRDIGANGNSWDTSAVTDMSNMFFGASSFNSDISDWDVRAATDMTDMFTGASSFDQNLGKWYVTPGGFDVLVAALPGAVGNVSAQNSFLDGQNPVYTIVTNTAGDHFEMDSGELSMAAAGVGKYVVEIGATGSLFGSGNARVVQVSVLGANPTPKSNTELDQTVNPTPKSNAGLDQTVNLGDMVTLDGAGSEGSGNMTYLWNQSAGTPVALSNTTDPRPTFIAPQSPDILAFTLLVTGTGEQADSDTVTITVMNVSESNSTNQRPVIELNGTSSDRILLGTSPSGAQCYDEEDGHIDPVTTGNLDVNKPGVYNVTYVCTDSDGLSASVNQTVTVVGDGSRICRD